MHRTVLGPVRLGPRANCRFQAGAAALAAALILLSAPAAPAEYAENDWPVSEFMRFAVHHQQEGSPRRFGASLELLFGDVRRKLWPLSRWLDSRKLHVYLYSSLPAYRRSSFGLPPWSESAAFIVQITDGQGGVVNDLGLATYPSVSKPLLAHELAHVVLMGFFRRSGRLAPRWVNEGLATSFEFEYRGKRPPLPKQLLPLSRLIVEEPKDDSPAQRVGAWYAQAESVVRFLRKDPGRFAAFCQALSAGKPLGPALKGAYGYDGVGGLEKAWRASLKAR